MKPTVNKEAPSYFEKKYFEPKICSITTLETKPPVRYNFVSKQILHPQLGPLNI